MPVAGCASILTPGVDSKVVDLTGDQRGLRRLRVGEPDELDAVDFHHLAARVTGRRLLAGNILLELLVDRLAARDPLVALEPEGTGADHLLDLLEGIDQGLLLAHHERNARARLGKRVDE